MDDPWGSPWATNDPNPILEPPPRASTNLELPGRTLTRVRSSSSISPWATIAEDGDGFGDWGASEPSLALPPPTAAMSSGGWSGWGGENGPMSNSSQTNLSVRAREGSLGLPSPSAWPGAPSPNLSHGKTLSRRSSAKSLFRQPSPDPWATEFSENRLSLPAAVHISAEQAAFSTLGRLDEVRLDDADKLKSEESEPGHDIGAEKQNNSDLDATPISQQKQGPKATPANEQHREYGREVDDHPDSLSNSRRSSISNDSRPDERLDSPLTSTDEDSKDRPALARRPSVKVQELVEMYDGLVTRKNSGTLLAPNPSPHRQRSASRSMSIRSARTDDASDFGDFEDAEGFVPSRQPSISGSPRPTSARGAHLRSISRSSLRKSSAVAPPITSPVLEENSGRFEELRAKFGPVTFAPDVELVDKLFDVEKLDKEQPAAKDYSLDAVDGIIKDSFTTVSERKTWYRISRPGTMRKHDMGDDDNYRRVTWAGSTVREDATTIVRRWTEEDTYTGRPGMGGRPTVKGGGFNWDSTTETREPLSFDEIFGKRKSVQSPKTAAAQIRRPLSLQPQPIRPPHSRTLSADVKSLPPRSPLGIPGPPAAPIFGWSSGANDTLTPASSRPSGQYVRQSLDVSSITSGSSRPPSIREPPSRNSLQLAPPPSVPPLDTFKKSKDPVQAVKEEEEDDEWGEMVASPAEENRPSSMLFESSMDGSIASLSATSTAPCATVRDTRSTLDAVSSKLENGHIAPEKDGGVVSQAVTAAPVDIWDFSAFDSKLETAPAIPPSTTSKPEFDFDTPLQSPTPTVPSRIGSPASLQLSKPSTPVIPPGTGTPASIQVSNPSTPPMPFRSQHGSTSSLSLGRPSPLHNVITPSNPTPKLPSAISLPARAASPALTSPVKSPLKAVTFAEVTSENEEDPAEVAAAKRVVDGLPDLLYMLQ